MRRLVPFAVALLVIWLAGCGEDPPQGKKGKGRVAEPNVDFPAPEIEGTDANGKRFRLSDYRGKVVLLDFWASWCRPCLNLVPHERALVKSLEGKPFVMLGVSADDTPQELREAEQEHRLSWRSIWDGPEGPIHRRWRVQSWPTLFVIDHEGVVRYRLQGSETIEEDLAAAIKDLLRKVPGEVK